METWKEESIVIVSKSHLLPQTLSDGLGYILLADSLIAYKNAEHHQNSAYLPVEFQIILFPKMVMLP